MNLATSVGLCPLSSEPAELPDGWWGTACARVAWPAPPAAAGQPGRSLAAPRLGTGALAGSAPSRSMPLPPAGRAPFSQASCL